MAGDALASNRGTTSRSDYRVHLADGQEVKTVTGIDDHSRFIVCAKVVLRATARYSPTTTGNVERLHKTMRAGFFTRVDRARAASTAAAGERAAGVSRWARDPTAGLTVTRLADGAGVVSFAGPPYACGRRWARTAIDVTIVAGSVQLSRDGKVIRVHPIRHDRSRELGVFANPEGRPRRKNSATGNVALRSCRWLVHE